MQWHLGQADQIKTDTVIYHAFRCESQEVLVDCKMTGTGGDYRHGQTGPGEVPVDMVFVEGVQSEVDGFEHIPVVCLPDQLN